MINERRDAFSKDGRAMIEMINDRAIDAMEMGRAKPRRRQDKRSNNCIFLVGYDACGRCACRGCDAIACVGPIDGARRIKNELRNRKENEKKS